MSLIFYPEKSTLSIPYQHSVQGVAGTPSTKISFLEPVSCIVTDFPGLINYLNIYQPILSQVGILKEKISHEFLLKTFTLT